MPLQKQRSRFLSAVHGTVAVAKAGNGADNGEIGQVRESEHFGSDADRSEPCIGSTAENGGITAICGCSEYLRSILYMAGIFTIVKEAKNKEDAVKLVKRLEAAESGEIFQEEKEAE